MNTAVIDPMARDLPNGLTWTRHGKVCTRTGLVIGHAYQPPVARLSAEDESIQRGLLGLSDECLVDVLNGLACALVGTATLLFFINAPAIVAWLGLV